MSLPDHGAVPGLPAGVGAGRHALGIEPVGDGRAVAIGPEPLEPLAVDRRGRRVLLPVVERPAVGGLYEAEDGQRDRGPLPPEAGHELVLDPLRGVGVVADVVAAGGDDVLLPGVVGGVDAVVRGDDAGAVVDGDAAEPVGLRASDDAAEVLGDEQVELAAPEHRLELGQLGPVEPLALARGGDGPVVGRAVVHLGHDLSGVIDLVFEGDLLLARAPADAGDDGHDQGVPVPGDESTIGAAVRRAPPGDARAIRARISGTSDGPSEAADVRRGGGVC